MRRFRESDRQDSTGERSIGKHLVCDEAIETGEAFFARKPASIDEIEEDREAAEELLGEDRDYEEPYGITEVMIVSPEQYAEIASDLLNPDKKTWEEPGGFIATEIDPESRACVQIINAKTNEYMLIDSQGYDYARYVARGTLDWPGVSSMRTIGERYAEDDLVS